MSEKLPLLPRKKFIQTQTAELICRKKDGHIEIYYSAGNVSGANAGLPRAEGYVGRFSDGELQSYATDFAKGWWQKDELRDLFKIPRKALVSQLALVARAPGLAGVVIREHMS